jgi:hypothetical protein|tara:strand:+ start:2576 stop:3229 length:654 start_codon:yes stop_codon:yes gene_type:complete
MKVPSFLKNKYVLKFLIFMAIVNVLGYVALEEFNSMALFIVMILLSRYFSKNTSINILIAIIVTSCFTLNNKVREGFKEKEKSKEPSKKEGIPLGTSPTPSACAKDEKMVNGECKKRTGFKNNVPPSSPAAVNNNEEGEIDVAAQMEDAYVNLNKMMGDGAMKSMASETKKLVNQQQDLMNTLHSMTPTLNKAKETLDNLDLPDMEQMTGILKKFTK